MRTSLSLAALATLVASTVAAPALKERADIAPNGSVRSEDTTQVQYSPAADWTRLSGLDETTYNGGTESYTHEADGAYIFPYDSQANWLAINAAKKADRGFFDVYYAEELIGVGDAHSDCVGNNCPSERIFEISSLPYKEGFDTVTVRNRAGDYRLPDGQVPVLAFDVALWQQL
ncbi:hypothetical protein JCM6882_004896 [Rhodosporidiobolus microsporus]